MELLYSMILYYHLLYSQEPNFDIWFDSIQQGNFVARCSIVNLGVNCYGIGNITENHCCVKHPGYVYSCYIIVWRCFEVWSTRLNPPPLARAIGSFPVRFRHRAG